MREVSVKDLQLTRLHFAIGLYGYEDGYGREDIAVVSFSEIHGDLVLHHGDGREPMNPGLHHDR